MSNNVILGDSTNTELLINLEVIFLQFFDYEMLTEPIKQWRLHGGVNGAWEVDEVGFE